MSGKRDTLPRIYHFEQSFFLLDCLAASNFSTVQYVCTAMLLTREEKRRQCISHHVTFIRINCCYYWMRNSFM
jgi:hypothetical protein